MNKIRCLLFLHLLIPSVLCAADMEITPFKTFNQQPTVQVYGMPLDSSAVITPSGRLNVALVEDVASSYRNKSRADEELVFDGESYRTTLAIKYGIGDRFEVGLNIPYVLYSGGFLDSFIIDWHDTFALPQGGRDRAPKGEVIYSYSRNGVEKLKMDNSGSGVGDISLTAGMKLYASTDASSRKSIALRGDLKLPTGKSSALRGSGSTDLAVSLCGSINNSTEWGTFGLFGSAGALAMTDSQVLADQHNNFAGFGTVGAGWGPTSWISFKVQLHAATPFYAHSSLKELSDPSLLLVTGGALLFPGDYQLDIGVAEDVAVGTAPDVTFHFGLSKLF
ncbi:MAG: hypothetical protein H6Q56_999 [Deltaproteobacteria bacterium]|nr:hypothetical protein [Deltaproteobacteria bacterium]